MTECASPIIDEIRRLVMQYAADKTGPQIESPIDGLYFSVRYGSTGTCTCSVYEPSVALMLQGRKMTTAGTRVYTYGRGDLLITSMDVPTTYQVLEASPDKPFVGIGIRIDAVVMTDLIRQLPLEDDAADDASVRAITLRRLLSATSIPCFFWGNTGRASAESSPITRAQAAFRRQWAGSETTTASP